MKKLKIPEGMLKAVLTKNYSPYDEELAKSMLTRALNWKRENPIVPTKEQLERIAHSTWAPNPEVVKNICTQFQRIMYDDPEPEVPEEIQKLVDGLFKNGSGQEASRLVLMSESGHDMGGWCKKAVTDQILEAYRRGLKKREE